MATPRSYSYTALSGGTVRGGIVSTVSLPTWVPAAGEITTLTVANGKLTNTWASQVAAYYSAFYDVMVCNDYSGGVLNPYFGTYGAVMFEGGGHAASNNNTVMQLELGATTCTFKRLTNPSNVSETISNTSIIDTDWGEYLADGQPISRHSYGAHTVVGPTDGGATYGTFWRLIVNSGGRVGVRIGQTPHKIDVTALTGQMAYVRGGTKGALTGPSASDATAGAPCWQAHVPSQQRIYLTTNGGGAANQPIWWYDLVTNTYVLGTGTSRTNDNNTDTGMMLYIPSRNIILFIGNGGAGGTLAIRHMDVSVSQPNWVNTPRTISASIQLYAGWSCVTWCPDNNRLIVGNVSGDANCVYEIEIPTDLNSTWTATRVGFTAGQTIPWVANNCYGKWTYNSKTKSIVYMPTASDTGGDTVYVYRPRGT